MNHWKSRRNRDCLDYSGYGSYPPILTPEEEAYYVNKFIEGRDIEARNILIERNLRLVPYIAKRFNNVDKDDLNSVGQIGLVKAVSSYDPGKGSRLATYATRCIENEILMYLRSQKKYGSEVSMQKPVGVDNEGNQITIEDKLAEEGYDIDEQVGIKLLSEVVLMYINSLSERDRMIVEMRYGLNGKREYTQREIAELLGISRSYV